MSFGAFVRFEEIHRVDFFTDAPNQDPSLVSLISKVIVTTDSIPGEPSIVAEPVQISLSRALKLKNRLIHRLTQLDTLIQTYNSTLEENQEYDIRELYKSRTRLMGLLIELKTSISITNQPIQKMIFELAELKSVIAVLNKMDTKHGASLEGYASVRAVYVAQIRKPEVDREVKRIEQEIDRLQDELDRFNYNTTLTIDRAMLADEVPESVPPFEL